MENLNNVPSTGTFGNSVQKINSNFDLVVNAINSLEYQTTRSKGILNYGQNPATVFPNAVAGDWCMILSQGNVFPATIKTYNGSTWSGSGTWNPDGVDLTQYAQKSEMTTAIANSLAQATARMGYGECTVNGTTLAVTIPNYILPTNGGCMHIKMSAVGTGASTLNVNNTGAKTLWYNGAAVSAQNTWEANEIISVFYDGTRFMASNSQGGGGKAEKILYDKSKSNLASTNVQSAIDELSTDSPFEVAGTWQNGTIRADGTPNYNNVKTRIVCDYIRVKNGSQIRVIHNGQKASVNVYYPNESYVGNLVAFTDTADAIYTINITGYDYGYIRLVVAKSDDSRIYVSDRLASFYVYPPMFEDEIVKDSVKIPTSNAVWNYRHTKNLLTCKGPTWVYDEWKGYAGEEMRLTLGSTSWDVSGIATRINMLNVRSYDGNGNYTDVIAVTIANASTLSKEYIFTVPSDSVLFRVAFRGAVGVTVSYILEPYHSNELFIEGKGNIASFNNHHVAAGRSYRVVIKNPDWDKTGITSNYLFFIAAIFSDNTYQYLALQTYNQPLNVTEYIVKMPSNSTTIRIGGRAARGENIYYTLDDVTYEELNTFKARGGIVVANWNIGHFSFGNNSSSSITSSNYATEVLRYNEVLKDLNADMVAVEEYSRIFGKDSGNVNRNAKDVLFNDYPYLNEGVAEGYGCQAMFNYKYMNGLIEKPLSAFGIQSTHLYSVCTIKVEGVDVKFVGIHFQWFNESSDAKEILQFQGIIDEFANDPYVIIAGDFNTKNINNFQMFANAGYTLANGGAFGVFDTFTDEKPSEYQTTLALDNIVTKGFIMSDVRVVRGHLSDHYPIVCRLMLKQN